MKKAKNAFSNLVCKVHMMLLCANSRVVAAGGVIFSMFVLNAPSAMAAVELFDKLSSSFKTVYLGMVALAPVVTGVAYVAAKIWQIAVPEKQGRAEPREWARNALVNYFLILAAGGILGFIGQVAGSIGGNTP